jgi:hypothetical protein
MLLEMAMGKYPPGITTPYLYPRQKNNSIGSPIYTGGYGFTPIPILTHVTKITLSDHPYTLVGMDLPPDPYPCGYGSPIGSPVPTKIKHLSKYYIIQMSTISI